MQLALADVEQSQADPGFATLRRIELDAGAWVDFVPGWLRGPTALFDRVCAATTWERRTRTMYERTLEVPRLLGHCDVEAAEPVPLVRGERRIERLAAIHPEQSAALSRELRSTAALLVKHYARLLERITLAYYRNGRDSVAFHGDRLGALRSDTVVAVLSLGARRRFVLRPDPARGSAMRPLTFHVGEGDLLVMGGTCQATWQHAVPKTRERSGPRVAVMFREGQAQAEV